MSSNAKTPPHTLDSLQAAGMRRFDHLAGVVVMVGFVLAAWGVVCFVIASAVAGANFLQVTLSCLAVVLAGVVVIVVGSFLRRGRRWARKTMVGFCAFAIVALLSAIVGLALLGCQGIWDFWEYGNSSGFGPLGSIWGMIISLFLLLFTQALLVLGVWRLFQGMKFLRSQEAKEICRAETEPPEGRVLATGCKKRLKVFGWVMGTVLVVLVLLRAIAGYVMEAWFDAKVAELKRRGEPTTLADLVPPAVPDNENAATLYMSAFEHPCFELDNAESPVGWRVSREKPLSASERSEARRIVERAAEPLALLRKAADRRSCRFPRHYAASEHIFDTSGNAEKLDAAADLLLTAIYVNREDGMADDVLRDCRALLAVSRVHAQELQAWFYGD